MDDILDNINSIRWSNVVILFLLLATGITFTDVVLISIDKYVVRKKDMLLTDKALLYFWVYFITILIVTILYILYYAETYSKHIRNLYISPVSVGVALPQLMAV